MLNQPQYAGQTQRVGLPDQVARLQGSVDALNKSVAVLRDRLDGYVGSEPQSAPTLDPMGKAAAGGSLLAVLGQLVSQVALAEELLREQTERLVPTGMGIAPTGR